MSAADNAFDLGSAFTLLAHARPESGPAGQRFGKGTGASLEFQEFRDYQAGDDLRHVDWRAYARTETLTTRLYREEIAATVELLLDGSQSMDLTEAKGITSRGLAAFLAGSASAESVFKATMLSDPPLPLPLDALRQANAEHLPFTGTTPLIEAPLAGLLKAGSVRVVISDFLFPHDARSLVQKLAARCSTFIVLQVLDPAEWKPTARGSLRLNDVESGKWRDISFDDRAAEGYQRRLKRLCESLQAEVRRAGGAYLRVLAREDLIDVVYEDLIPTGMVEPR